MASTPEQPTEKLMGPDELASIYPNHSTRWKVYDQVKNLILGEVMDPYTANFVLRLGEPAVYGALQAFTGGVEELPEDTVITVASIVQ